MLLLFLISDAKRTILSPAWASVPATEPVNLANHCPLVSVIPGSTLCVGPTEKPTPTNAMQSARRPECAAKEDVHANLFPDPDPSVHLSSDIAKRNPLLVMQSILEYFVVGIKKKHNRMSSLYQHLFF